MKHTQKKKPKKLRVAWEQKLPGSYGYVGCRYRRKAFADKIKLFTSVLSAATGTNWALIKRQEEQNQYQTKMGSGKIGLHARIEATANLKVNKL